MKKSLILAPFLLLAIGVAFYFYYSNRVITVGFEEGKKASPDEKPLAFLDLYQVSDSGLKDFFKSVITDSGVSQEDTRYRYTKIKVTPTKEESSEITFQTVPDKTRQLAQDQLVIQGGLVVVKSKGEATKNCLAFGARKGDLSPSLKSIRVPNMTGHFSFEQGLDVARLAKLSDLNLNEDVLKGLETFKEESNREINSLSDHYEWAFYSCEEEGEENPSVKIYHSSAQAWSHALRVREKMKSKDLPSW